MKLYFKTPNRLTTTKANGNTFGFQKDTGGVSELRFALEFSRIFEL